MGSSTTVIGGEYLVLGKIGEGSFGEVFRATHIATGVDYAIKREPINVAHPQLEHEAEMYRKLAGGVGIPTMHWFGKEGQYNAIVMDLLGPNLKQVRRENSKLPLSFVIELGVQMISQLEYIHKKGYVYRDVKPENFLLDADMDLPEAPIMAKSHTPPAYPDPTMGYFNDTRRRQYSIESDMSTSPDSPSMATYNNPHLSIVDFGLVAPYRDASGKHLPNKGCTKKNKVGTARYASINIHCGREHARRDDVESIGYMLLEFVIGNLPWSGMSARNSRQGWAKMKEIKEEIELDELCDGLPKGFMTYIGYTRSLRFDEEPDYDYLKSILRASAGRGAEAHTVRCYREPPMLTPSRSLENCSGGGGAVPIHTNHHRSQDPFKSKERSKENPLKDWRNRPHYSPPQRSRHPPYSPTSLWTTTPPNVVPKEGQLPLVPPDVHEEMKDKIEWEVAPDTSPDADTDRSSSMWGDDNHEGHSRPRKCSWGEDDPNARWGEEYDDGGEKEQDDGDELFQPFHIGSFQDETALATAAHSTHGEKGSNGYTNGHGKTLTSNWGRQYAPQDARFYSDEPPVGLKPRLGNGSGFIQSNNVPLTFGKIRPPQGPQHPMSIHPFTRDMPPTHQLPPLSPSSLSSSFSSLSIQAGGEAQEESGIERHHVSSNRYPYSETDGSERSQSGRKLSNPTERGRNGTNDSHDMPPLPPSHGWGERSQGNGHMNGGNHFHQHLYHHHHHHHHYNNNGNGNGNANGNSNGKSRGGSDGWQQVGRHGQGRPGRRQHHGSQEPSGHGPENGLIGGPHEQRSRQNSGPGMRTQPGPGSQPIPSPKGSYYNHNHSHNHNHNGHPMPSSHPGHHDQARSTGLGSGAGLGSGPGFGDHRRQTRSRKSSNASLSSLTDQWVPNKAGNGSLRIKPK